VRRPDSSKVHILIFGAGFKSKKIRVNLNQPIKAEVKAESTDVLKTVDEDRKYVIQATIVRYVHPCCDEFTSSVRFRIMKARKVYIGVISLYTAY
jgi:hypothetical protein